MTDESIKALESAALAFAAAHQKPHRSIQEHNAECAIASANLIAAALNVTENDSTH